jgi:carbonic anhydrase
MSVFSSQSSWTGMCSGSNQSPINLAQSISKPCKGTCDLKIDDTNATSGQLSITDEGLLLTGRLGSCKFRDATYTCQALLINHPSHHTIESIQSDGEVISIFISPTGDTLLVSSLFRVSSSPTPSIDFFKQIVPYSQSSSSMINLNGWSLQHMVPSDGSYFVYDGSSIIPPCSPAEVIVYKSMINIDQTDFAYLVKNVQAGSRSIQALGNREIFYNDNADTGFLPHDNKTYFVMKPLANNKKKKPLEIKKTDLKTTQGLENSKEPSTLGKVSKKIQDNWDEYLDIFWMLLFYGGVMYLLYKFKDSMYYLVKFFNWWRGDNKSHVKIPGIEEKVSN